MTTPDFKYPKEVPLVNAFFVSGDRVLKVVKVNGKRTLFKLSNRKHLLMKDIENFSIQCSCCRKIIKRIFTVSKNDGFFLRKYLCKHCSCSKKRNSFWGRKHSLASKKKISRNHANMKGDNNPFFGRKHTAKAIHAMRMKLIGRKPTLKERRNVSKGLRQFQNRNRSYTKFIRSKGGYASARSREKYKINKLEQKVKNWLDCNYPNAFQYSVILSGGQFDFGSKENRILVEVNGDYWHCNPKIYPKPKNELQNRKRVSDLKKKSFATKHNFTLLTIWEQDVNNGNFSELKEKIDEILSLSNQCS